MKRTDFVGLSPLGYFLRLDFGPARTSQCSLQFIVINKIYVEITNTRDNRFNVYFPLVVNGYT